MNNNYIPLITNISLHLNTEINIKPNNNNSSLKNNSPNLISLNKYINSNNLNNSYKNKKNSLNLEETIGNFIIGKSLGKGTFGKVKIGTHKITGEKVAIKILLKEKFVDNIDKTRMIREIKILKNTFHFNIIKIYEVIETETSIYLIMEFAEKGELFNYIIQKKRLNELESLKFFHQIIDAVDYMHKLGICHRDLKPENMLLDFQNNLKIIDFGLSNLYVINELLQTPCGSPGYASPEMIKGDKYNGYKSDIWSCGIILYVMLCGFLPFDEENEQKLFEKIIKGKFTLPNFLSNEVKDLLKLILTTNPYKRIDINGIRKHEWYNKFNYEIVEGLFVNCMNIPIDNYVINELKKYGKNEENVKKDVIKNYHNDNTTSYYLLVKKNNKKGIESISDLYSKKFSDYIKKFRFIYFPLKNLNNNNKILNFEDYYNNIFNNKNNKKKLNYKNKSFDKNENEKNYNLKSCNNNNNYYHEHYDKYINLTDNVITDSNIDIENDFRENTNFDNNSKNISKNKNNKKNNNNKILNFEKILNKKKHFLNFNLTTIKTQLKSNYENYIKKNKKNKTNKKSNFLNTSSTYIRVLKKNNSFNSKYFNINKKPNNNFKPYNSKKNFHPLSLTKDRKSISKEKNKKNTFYSNYKYGIKKNFLLLNYYNKKLKKKNSKNLSIFINKNNNKNNIINLSTNCNLDKNKGNILFRKYNHSYDKSSNDNKLKEKLNIKVNINNYNNYKINYLKKNNKTISEPNSSSINTKSTFNSDIQNEINKKNYKNSVEKYINKNCVIKNLEKNSCVNNNNNNKKKKRAISTEIKNNNNIDNKNNDNNNIENDIKNNYINLPYYLGEIDVNKIIYKDPYKIRENINYYFPIKKIYINNNNNYNNNNYVNKKINNYNNSYFKIKCNKGINKFKIDFYRIKNINGIYVDINLLEGNKKEFENILKTVYEILNY